MKQSISIFILLLTIIPGIVLASDPEGMPLSLKQAKIIATPIKKNKTTGTWNSNITIKNKSKLRQNLFGPLTLLVSTISRNDVTLENASGQTSAGLFYVSVPMPLDGLAYGKSVKNIKLKFSNPSKKPFKVKYKIFGFNSKQPCYTGNTTYPVIQSITPSNGATGTVISVNGNDFTECSKIYFNNQEIKNTHYVSKQRLEVVIPFDADEKLTTLTPLAGGDYPVKVDNSQSYNYTVSELPENTALPGTVIENIIENIYTSISENEASYRSTLLQLLTENSDIPENKKALEALDSALTETLSHDKFNISKKFESLGQQNLASLERVLLPLIPKSNAKAQSFTSIGNNIAISNQTNFNDINIDSICSNKSGDEWVKCRAEIAIMNQYSNKLMKLLDLCQIDKICEVINDFAGDLGVHILLSEIFVSANIGSVRFIHPLWLNHDSPYPASQETTTVTINNYINNIERKSESSKMITGAILGINKTADIGAIIKVLGKPLDSIPFAGSILSKLLDALAEWKTNQVNKPTELITVTTNVLKHELTYGFYETASLKNIILDNHPPCSIHDSDGYYAVETKPVFISPPDQWWFFHVPDAGGSTFNSQSIGECQIRIDDKYRLTIEDNINAKVNFYVDRFAKATINLENEGSVTYDRLPESKNTECSFVKSPCIEFFDVPIHEQITLTGFDSNGSTDNHTTWSGTGLSSFNCPSPSSTCAINLDVKNLTPPEISASFGGCTAEEKNAARSELAGVWTDTVYGDLKFIINSDGENGTLDLTDTNSSWGCPSDIKITLGWNDQKNPNDPSWACLNSMSFYFPGCANSYTVTYPIRMDPGGEKIIDGDPRIFKK